MLSSGKVFEKNWIKEISLIDEKCINNDKKLLELKNKLLSILPLLLLWGMDFAYYVNNIFLSFISFKKSH